MAEITRYRPTRPVRSLREEVNRLFGDFLPATWDEEETFTAVWTPRMDLSETDAGYLVKMDLPGLSKEDITINVENRQLSVSGERKEEKKEEKENFLHMERSYGRFYRAMPLPKSVKEEDVKAEFNDGVLRIHIPKSEESKPRKIEIS